MEFTLTSEIADLIVFAMENQEDEFVFDIETSELVPVEEMPEEDAEEDEGRYVPIPEWTSADGFRLMEQFVGNLQNPVYREKLSEALSAGRGVFRRFKDTVKERPEIERQWHSFKDQAMRDVVTEWYNDLRETWGLERVAFEQSETEDLVLTDFSLRRASDDPRELEELRRVAREQYRETGTVSWGGAGGARAVSRAAAAGSPAKDEPPVTLSGSIAFVAEAPAGETAAAVWALGEGAAGQGAGTSSQWLVVHTLYVYPSFRGLGLARLLLERLVEATRKDGWKGVSLDLVRQGLVLEDTATGLGFQTVAKRVALEVE